MFWTSHYLVVCIVAPGAIWSNQSIGTLHDEMLLSGASNQKRCLPDTYDDIIYMLFIYRLRMIYPLLCYYVKSPS
jgi:hypothetical protein